MESAKKFLHGWLGHRKLGFAVYQDKGQYVQSGVGTMFMNEVRSDSFPYLVGVGNGRTKKGAMEMAAQDLCQKLININQMEKADFMSLKIQRDGVDDDGNATGGPSRLVQGNEIEHSPATQSANTDEGRWDGWTLERYETVFDEFCVAEQIVVTNKSTPVGYGEHSAILGELNFKAQGSKTPVDIYARAEGKTKKLATAECAKKAVHELYNKNLIEIEAVVVKRTCEKESSVGPSSSVATEPVVSSIVVPPNITLPPNMPRAVKQEIDADSDKEKTGEASGNNGDRGPSTSAYNQNEDEQGDYEPVAKKKTTGRGRGRPPKNRRGRN